MKIELLSKFHFEASHSLTGYEEPHPHRWTLEVSITGKPIEGRIIDMVELRNAVQEKIDRIHGTYLNDSLEVDEQVRRFPTCESLCHFFLTTLNNIIHCHFLARNPSVALHSIEIRIAFMDGIESGAARLSL